jgi:hypothetical protein
MAREAILRDTGPLVKRRYTCATSTGIAKGCFLKLSADLTAAASTGTGDIFVGFAHADVNSSTDTAFNTETSITAEKGAIYELVASGAITKGDLLETAAPGNYVMSLAANTSSHSIVVGVALEDATAGETINVEVFP